MLLLLVFTAVQAACPSNNEILKADIKKAQTAWSDWAWDDFDAAATEVKSDLTCMTEVIEDPASVHELFAFVGARKQDEALVIAAYRGVLFHKPNFELDLAVAAEGSLLRNGWQKAKALGAGDVQVLPDGYWYIDGKPSQELPLKRIAYTQLQENGGMINWYLVPDELPQDFLNKLSTPVVDPVESHLSRGLLVSGIAFLAVGVGSMAAGEVYENKMWKTDVESEARAAYRKGRIATLGGVGLSTVGVGLSLGAVIKGQW